eukprot:CAMPEP_0197691708 /NCGR_PEP_ID=MMETSP1338-20131121/110068_1 /TAXON_ID=43686 ORGANISM="Pelagodinium beii, Strain RCC1491" /NCGR_SAMPLE_ID=MMETSP1338 /ASSEMBLY_ACC=CAM_ASM_000754 /LENGTH=290 /DNA_ID=CAMNT_0043274285 /DNA_START=251 /DNA_END=1119 /DNA_ORIENTATION=-
MLPLIALILNFVGPDKKAQAILFQEALRDIWSKSDDITPSFGLPRLVTRVGPEKISEDFVAFFFTATCDTVQRLDFAQANTWFSRESTVANEHVRVDDVGKWEPVKHSLEQVVSLQTILRKNFSCETIGRFMSGASWFPLDSRMELGQATFQAQQKKQHFDREGSSIDKVPVEDERILSTRQTVVLKNGKEIKELPMNVTNHVDMAANRHLQVLERTLLLQDLQGILHEEPSLVPRPTLALAQVLSEAQGKASCFVRIGPARVLCEDSATEACQPTSPAGEGPASEHLRR